MADPSPPSGDPISTDVHTSRLQLLWDVVVFQFKLLFDGVRDLLLSPLSILAAIFGMLAGGDDPQQYFRRLLRLGRRTEVWLNLFGHHRHEGTSDRMIDPLRERVFTEAKQNPWISRAGNRLNEQLDNVNRQKPGDGA
jgi:hypothetical protein